MGQAVASTGGVEALQLRVAEQYVREFGNLARAATTLVLLATLSDVGSMIALAMKVVQKDGHAQPTLPRTSAPNVVRPPPPSAPTT